MSEFKPINHADSEEEIIDIKKSKRDKSTLKGLTKKVESIIENEEKSVFNKQVLRKDVLANMLANIKLTGKELFDVIMKENKELYDKRRQGWIFETILSNPYRSKVYRKYKLYRNLWRTITKLKTN